MKASLLLEILLPVGKIREELFVRRLLQISVTMFIRSVIAPPLEEHMIVIL